jgi:hypothetical protein
MRLRTLIAGSATLLLALPSLAVIKTYSADTDLSTRFPTDKRIYRGDCDTHAATDDRGDTFPDQCTCTPGTNCSVGALPGECSTSAGRPNGGACDPTIPSGPGSCTGTILTPATLHGSTNPACNYTQGGSVVINDTGNGTPTLTSMLLVGAWTDFVGGQSVTGIPGTTVELRSTTSLGPAPNQTGTGSTTTSINWGSLTGWTQTGRLFCRTSCPGGCGGASSCLPFGVVESSTGGYGPPAPLKASAFTTDPWTFQGGGNKFHAVSFEVVSLGLGAVTAAIQPGGRLVTIPALPLAALGGLGAGLVYLGSRALSRKRD